MGFWRIAKGVLTLGMSFDLEHAQADLKKLMTKYDEIRYGITAMSERMSEAIARLRREFKATKRDLNSASKIICPPFTKTGRAVINHPTHSTALQVSGKNTVPTNLAFRNIRVARPYSLVRGLARSWLLQPGALFRLLVWHPPAPR